MESKKISEFYKKLEQSGNLKPILKEKIQQIKNEEDLRKIIEDEIIPLSRKMGMNFTTDELMEYEKQVNKALSDTDLENISGGALSKDLFLGGLVSLMLFSSVYIPSTGATGTKCLTKQQTDQSQTETVDNINTAMGTEEQQAPSTEEAETGTITQTPNPTEETSETYGVNTEISNLFKILSNDSIPKASETMAKAYYDLMSYITDYRNYAEIKSVYNFLEKLDDSYMTTQISKYMCEAFMKLCCINIISAVDQFKLINEQIEKDNLLDDVFYHDFYAKVKNRASNVIRMYENTKKFLIEREIEEKQEYQKRKEEEEQKQKQKRRIPKGGYSWHHLPDDVDDIDEFAEPDTGSSDDEKDYRLKPPAKPVEPVEPVKPAKPVDFSVNTESLYFKRNLCSNLERNVQVEHLPSFIKNLSLIADGPITDFYGVKNLCQTFVEEFISFIYFDPKYDSSKNNVFFNVIDEFLKQINKNIESCSCSEEEKNLLFNYVKYIQDLRELSEKSLFAANPDDFEELKRVSDDLIKIYKNKEFCFERSRNLVDPIRKFIPIEEKMVRNKLKSEEDFKEFNAALVELEIFVMEERTVYLHNSSENLLQFKEKVLNSSLTKEQKEHLTNRIESIFAILKAKKLYKLNTIESVDEAIKIYKELRSKINPDVDEINKTLYEFIGNQIESLYFEIAIMESHMYNNPLKW